MKNGITPLHYAAATGDLDICRLIIKNIKDKNPTDHRGETPKDWAQKASWGLGLWKEKQQVVDMFESLNLK